MTVDAFGELLAGVRRAERFGVHPSTGGVRFGWDGTKPGEPARIDGKLAWERHDIYEPMTVAELESLRAHLSRVGRPSDIPTVLAEFYTGCANGLSLACGDLSVFGYQRPTTRTPFDLVTETLAPPPGAGPSAFFFGAWGGERNRVYLDADGGVHVAGLASAQPLLSWPDFPTFLRDACAKHLASFDVDGRRIGQAALPPEGSVAAAVQRVPDPPPWDPRSLTLVASAIAGIAGRTVKLKGRKYEIVDPSRLAEVQLGYSCDPSGSALSGDRGAWLRSWIVIGTERDLGDPLFVDADDPGLPVFTAQHGVASWAPESLGVSVNQLSATGSFRGRREA